MRAWLKLACVVLAWTILPAGVITAGPGRPVHPVQASTRTAHLSSIIVRPATPPASSTAPAQPASGHPASGQPASGQAIPKPPAPASSGPPTAHQAQPQPQSRPRASTGMPSWLKTMLLAVGLLAVVIFAAETFLVARRRRRRISPVPPHPATQTSPVPQDSPAGQAAPTSSRPARPCRASSPPEVPVMSVPAHPGRIKPARIVMADHDRLVVTRNKADDTICVLRPPGEDPADILRVARLVLSEDHYGTLAEQLGLPANWPMNQLDQ